MAPFLTLPTGSGRPSRHLQLHFWASGVALALWLTGPWPLRGDVFDIKRFGAIGDGLTLDTAAINQAIEAGATAGGGVVLFPAGRYLSGTIHLRSGLTFVLDPGAVIVGTTNLDAYHGFRPPPETPEARFPARWHRALLLGDGITNLSIVGSGTIDGNRVFDPRGEERMRGPHTILLGNGREIKLQGISIRDSANYAVILEGCSQVEIRDVQITGGWDGVHFRGWPGRPCREVKIIGCQFYTGDDSIAGRYWDNVLIADCIINSSCNGVRLIGPAVHLLISDCLFYGPGIYPHRTSNRHNMLAAVNLQPGAWDATEGLLDDVLIAGVTAHNVTTPFHFALKEGNTAGTIVVSRANATGVYLAPCSVESWAQAPFTNVTFRDFSMQTVDGGNSAPTDATVKSPGVDARPLPAWGFFVRNVEQFTLDGVRLATARPDRRHVLIGERVQRLTLRDFAYPEEPGQPAPFLLREVGSARLLPDGRPALERALREATASSAPVEPQPQPRP